MVVTARPPAVSPPSPVVARITRPAPDFVTRASRPIVPSAPAVSRRNVRVLTRSPWPAPVDGIVAATATVLDLPRRVLVADVLELVARTRVHHAPPAAMAVRVVLGIIVDHDVIAHARVRVDVPGGTPVVTVVADEARIVITAADVVLGVVHRVVVVLVVHDTLGDMVHRDERIALDVRQPVIVPVVGARELRESQRMRAHDREDVADPGTVVDGERAVAVAAHLSRFAPPHALIVARTARIEDVDAAIGVDPADDDEAIVRRPEAHTDVITAPDDVTARRPELDARLEVAGWLDRRNRRRFRLLDRGRTAGDDDQQRE
jgi:hypothetical protein